jgi:hypothetical protein
MLCARLLRHEAPQARAAGRISNAGRRLMEGGIGVMPWINPVSWTGKKPLGITIYR